MRSEIYDEQVNGNKHENQIDLLRRHKNQKS